MTIAITHKFVSAKGDGTDTTLVRPSNWNDTHTIQCASGIVLGRQSAGTGNAEELTCSSAAASLLAQPDIASILSYLGITLPTTGDGKLTLKTAADTGWVMMNDGTIGSASSGASTRANADCQALFTLLYNNVSDANAPVLTSGGAASTRAAQGSASAAWAANCRMTLTKQLGRAIIIAGSGASLTTRALGEFGGEEAHLLATNELPAHQHAVYLRDQGHAHSMPNMTSGGIYSNSGNNAGSPFFQGSSTVSTNTATTGITIGSVSGTANDNQTANAGGGASHNNMQPFTAWNIMVKL